MDWDNESSREKDAWIAVNIFGWRWMRFDGCGGRPEQRVACVPPDAPNRTIYNFHPSAAFPATREDMPRFSDWDRVPWRDDDDPLAQPSRNGFPRYTTDASADYLILCKVREEWSITMKRHFEDSVAMLDYEHSREFPDESPAVYYRPGDYSHAAFLAMQK